MRDKRKSNVSFHNTDMFSEKEHRPIFISLHFFHRCPTEHFHFVLNRIFNDKQNRTWCGGLCWSEKAGTKRRKNLHGTKGILAFCDQQQKSNVTLF